MTHDETRPRIFGTLVVQNEVDIIAEVLDFHERAGVLEKIFLYDLGSTDGTFERALSRPRLLHEPRVLDAIYTEDLRKRLLLEHRHLFRPGDWFALVDADEFYAEDPREIIDLAEREGSDCVGTFQIEFQFTDLDLSAAASENPELSVAERRRFYLIDWSEIRFYKYLPDDPTRPLEEDRPCRRRMLNRHFQYRSPAQIEQRIRTRLANRERSLGLSGRQSWRHVFSDRWQDYVRPHRLFHEADQASWRFGLPAGRSVSDYAETERSGFDLASMALELEQERKRWLESEPEHSGVDA